MRSAALAACLALSSCCTIARPRATVAVTSDPPGAAVQMGDAKGVTPCKLLVDRQWDPVQFVARLGDMAAAQEIPKNESMHFGVSVVLFVECLMILPAIVDGITGSVFDTARAIHVDFRGSSPVVTVAR